MGRLQAPLTSGLTPAVRPDFWKADMEKPHNPLKKLQHEVRLISKRGRQVWRLVPARFKWALGGASLLMAFTSLTNVAIPLFLGNLVDQIKRGTEGHVHAETLFEHATYYLLLIGAAYLLREVVQVARRYFVENT